MTKDKDDTHPNLRRRKQVTDSTTKEETTTATLMETSSTTTSIILSPENGEAIAASSSSSSSSQTDGYRLLPLKERSILWRLDVWPFMVCYGFLIFLDYYYYDTLVNKTTGIGISIGIPSNYFTVVAFPIVFVIHFGLFWLQQWDVSWRARVGYQTVRRLEADHNYDWTHCFVQAPHVDKHDASHDSGIVPVILHQKDGTMNQGNHQVVVIAFQDVIFRYQYSQAEEEDVDVRLWKKQNNVEMKGTKITTTRGGFHRLQYPINLPITFYKQWRGHQSMKDLLSVQQTYGSNTMNVNLPPFLELLQEQVLAPFFLFQMLCVLLWSLDEYWYYAIFTFLALLMFESTMAYNRLKSLERLRSHTLHDDVVPRLIWVYRPSYPPGENGWVQVTVSELVPGDLVSCKPKQQQNITWRGGESKIQQRQLLQSQESDANNYLGRKQQQVNRVPADILILSGDAVADESLLTGESIPQLKVAMEGGESNAFAAHNVLDLQEHKQSILFGGTTLVVGQSGDTSLAGLPNPPDEGVIGMVLRTGFETAQGSLLRTMAHTQKTVDGIHTQDTYVFIVLLLFCAIGSAAVVWQEGWNDPTRNKFRLCLHVVIIVTSVVPPELPMELSLAVTNSLADLMKRKIFCTEAFRIPLAGQIDWCCFDKTGTLTSDEMQLIGCRLAISNSNVVKNASQQISFSDVVGSDCSMPWPMLRIMVACHSLAVNVSKNSVSNSGDVLIGDPLEKALLENTGYRMDQNGLIQNTGGDVKGPDSVFILRRFGFSSKLKRMSVVVRESGNDTSYVLTKGAPETIKEFLAPESLPSDYDDICKLHMGLGQRVLAVAYRELSSDEKIMSVEDLDRHTMESGLIFAGLLLLSCPVKKDSKAIVTELLKSGNKVAMITGDAMLTAVEVSRQVGIFAKNRAGFPRAFHLQYIQPRNDGSNHKRVLSNFAFVPLSLGSERNDDIGEKFSLEPSVMKRLQTMVSLNEIALCISGDILQLLVTMIVRQKLPNDSSKNEGIDEKQLLFHPDAQLILKDVVPLVRVFARHAPRQKEAVISALNLGGFKTLMCGDGTNDMGALKRSHVGVSLISAPEVEAKQRSAAREISKAKSEQKKVKKSKDAKAKVGLQSKSSLEKSLRKLQEAQDELDQIDLGDASIASPFTSRVVSISCCKDILKQGRCTLVTMLQIYKILGVSCLVNATVLSKLFLHGVKQGDRQMTTVGFMVAALFFFVTRGKPLPNLSPVKPPTSVLCFQALASISVQFAIHFSAMMIATEIALSFVDTFDPSLIPDGPFNPNVLNTCTFLISSLATVNTFAVNYRGEPFVEPLRKNKMLWRSLQICYVLLFSSALELFPPINDLLQLAELPDTTGKEYPIRMEQESSPTKNLVVFTLREAVENIGFPSFLSCLMLADTVLTFLCENVILKLFQH